MTARRKFKELSPGVVVRGPLLPEPVEVITAIPMGESVKLIANGLRAHADRRCTARRLHLEGQVEETKVALGEFGMSEDIDIGGGI